MGAASHLNYYPEVWEMSVESQWSIWQAPVSSSILKADQDWLLGPRKTLPLTRSTKLTATLVHHDLSPPNHHINIHKLEVVIGSQAQEVPENLGESSSRFYLTWLQFLLLHLPLNTHLGFRGIPCCPGIKR